MNWEKEKELYIIKKMEKENKELNFNMEEDYNNYFLKQFIFIIVNLFLFFIISYYYFSFIATTFFMWVGIVISILYIYIDLKFNRQIMDLRKQIKNLQYQIDNSKRKK